MPMLGDKLRRRLEKTIKDARKAAEAGARMALESLAVHHNEPHDSMNVEERALRIRLRAHGRQLGDKRHKIKGTQSIERLVHECAYEHWHRMLFARFLAENHLLLEPSSKVAITLEECTELARENNEDPWAMAAQFAQSMLPQIFRPEDPVLAITLPPEARRALQSLISEPVLPQSVFTADDSLGWTYQYWQAEKKDEVNKSGNKIGADELPAVTQLFTEHYMVLFLYHNTIGAWHAGKVLAKNPILAETAECEEELRQAVRLQSQGGYDFKYLRFVRQQNDCDEDDTPTGPWHPAAGAFEGWPETAKELKVLDPCCGSGHFLTECVELLVRLRMDEEGIPLESAIRGVMAHNLHGLELDHRCTQIAAFNLALTAWKLAGKPIDLPALHVACSGLAVESIVSEWTMLAGEDERLRLGMENLHTLFNQAPELGSLIEPKELKGSIFQANFNELRPLLDQVVANEKNNDDKSERAVTAQGMACAAELVSSEYTLAITNVPYLGRRQHGDILKTFAERHYNEAKADLATVFISRILKWLRDHGTVAAVAPHNWLFLKSYASFRKKLLKRTTWRVSARLGGGADAFQDGPGNITNINMLILSKSLPTLTQTIRGLDVSDQKSIQGKVELLQKTPLSEVAQATQLSNPDARISMQDIDYGEPLSDYAKDSSGILTSDSDCFFRRFWELENLGSDWEFLQTTVPRTTHFGGMYMVVLWENESGQLARLANSVRHLNHAAQNWRRGQEIWGQEGVAVSCMGTLRSTLYTGSRFDNNTAVVIPRSKKHLAAIWCFMSSSEYDESVRRVDQKMNVTNATLVKVPFDLEYWKRVATEKYPSGLPSPHSDDPTQWLFHGNPAIAETATVLQVAIGRLLGYQWPTELDPEMRLADGARKKVRRSQTLRRFTDEDGIVCLSATRGERSASERLRELIAVAFGSQWSAVKERELLAIAGDGKKPATSLKIWLRDKFFEEHCKLFHHRPFIWHIWDGNKTGFSALVNCHKLTGPDGEGHRTLEALTHSYLGEWIERQRAEQQEGKEGADARLAAALDLQGQLEKILEGEPPYDIFVRWKPLHEQAIGWNPDINDGVRLNIRPFMEAELRTGGKKGAGILRWKPNIKWKKDRGKEPQSLRPRKDFPWFWGCPGEGSVDERTDFTGSSDFDGNRWNDLHLTNDAKRAARERAEKEDG